MHDDSAFCVHEPTVAVAVLAGGGAHGPTPRVLALAILGRDDAALAALERGFAAGDLDGWWYDVDREPAFAALREDARFKTVAAQARAHVRAERKLLEQMRRDGTVPLRTMSASTLRPC